MAETTSTRLLYSMRILFLLPLVGSLTAFVFPANARSVENPSQRPSLVFEQYLIDRHLIDPDETKVRVYYRFVNNGQKPLTIKGIQPSCGCLQIRIPEMTYQPGDSGEFQLELDTTKSIPGPKQYDIEVTYNDPQPQSTKLMFRAMIAEKKVMVRPRALIFYQFNANSTSQELTVHDYRKSPLKILRAESSSPLATVEPIEQKPSAPAELRGTFKITVQGNIPSGRHRAAITLHSDDPETPEIQVPLLIEGPPSQPVATPDANGESTASPRAESTPSLK